MTIQYSTHVTNKKALITYSEIVPKELHDESAVFVRVLLQIVQLRNSVIKCL